ncbi:MAG: hypothetical protein FWD49_07770 [Firmicutes bacterium]|nr:hypothetical protein [Bacillota bacterium]
MWQKGNKFTYWLRRNVEAIKCDFFRLKPHFFICLGCLLFGLLVALFKDYSIYEKCSSFLYAISLGSFNPFGTAVLIILFTTLAFALTIFSGAGFLFFCLFGYGGISLASYLIFKNAFIAVAVGGFIGVLYLMLFILPVVILNWLWLSRALCCVYEISGFAGKKCFVKNVSFRIGYIVPKIKHFYIKSICFNFLLWVILTIIFSIIY